MGRETFGGRIERLRGLAGLSARELDALAGLRAGHTRSIETGAIGPAISARTLSQIADVFDVSIDWLFNGTGPAPKDESVRKAVASTQRRAGRQKTGTTD